MGLVVLFIEMNDPGENQIWGEVELEMSVRHKNRCLHPFGYDGLEREER